MSWLYLPAVVEDSSPPNICLDSKPYATWKMQHTPSKYSRPGSKTGCSMTPPSGTTYERSMGNPGMDAWISSLRASRANRSVEQEKASPIETIEISGLIPFASLEKSDQNGSYWKMYQDCFATLMPDEYSATWPRAGTIVAGIAYLLRPSAPITREIGCGSWPTPTVDAANERKTRYAQGGTSLSYAVKMWPTPQSRDGKGPPGKGCQERNGRMSSLPAAVKMWPTPTARDRHSKGPAEAHRHSPSLSYAVEIWPTPTAGDSRGSRTSERAKELYSAGPTLLEKVWGDRPGGKLNPNWEEWLMGWPIGWTALEPLPAPRFQKWLQQFKSKEPTWWQTEPKIARTINKIPNQVKHIVNKRIAAIGEGQVPAVVRVAWRTLCKQNVTAYK